VTDQRRSQIDPFRSVVFLDSRPSQHYSITSSARSSTDCGTVIPSALADLRLIVSSSLLVRLDELDNHREKYDWSPP
jgi:hypothetical protein